MKPPTGARGHTFEARASFGQATGKVVAAEPEGPTNLTAATGQEPICCVGARQVIGVRASIRGRRLAPSNSSRNHATPVFYLTTRTITYFMPNRRAENFA